jgi:hypothetical protein
VSIFKVLGERPRIVRGIGEAVTEQSVHTIIPIPTGRTALPSAMMAPLHVLVVVKMKVDEMLLKRY